MATQPKNSVTERIKERTFASRHSTRNTSTFSVGRGKARETGSQTDFLNYREWPRITAVHTTDGYRVMEVMAERVPGVKYVDGHFANPDIDATTKIEKEHSRRVEPSRHRGSVRAHRER